MAVEKQANQASIQNSDTDFLSASCVREGEVLPMSFSQNQLWFLQRLDPAMTAYNLPRMMRLHAAVDADALERAFKAVIARHAILRTRFFEQDGVPVQLVQADVPFTLRQADLSKQQVDQALLNREIEQVVSHVFDLGQAPALVAKLIKVAAQDHVLVFCMHHIVSDGWSNPIFAKDLFSAYQMALASDGDVYLPPLAFQYGDFALWQREQQARGEWERQLAYWNGYLGPLVPPLELPSIGVRRAGKRFKGANLHFALPEPVQTAVRRFCKNEKLTPFVPLFAAWQALLAKYSDQQDFAIGVPHAGRSREEFHDLIGYFINPLVFRVRLTPELTWRELCLKIRADLLANMGNADLPFERLLAERPERQGGAIDPLFQSLFNFQQDGGAANLSLGAAPIEFLEHAGSSAKVDISLSIALDADQIHANLEFNTDVLDEQAAARLKDSYIRILAHLADSAEQRIGNFALLNDQEQVRLTRWGVNAERYPDAQPVHRLIEAQAAARPDAVALVFGDEELSYAEINARANRLAHRLIALGVGPEVRVGVALERSTELVVNLLAILKAGGAYVSLDPDYPAERLAYMMEDSGIGLLLTHSALRDRLPTTNSVQLVNVDGINLSHEPANNSDVQVSGENLCYVIYTSGSTGKPKGTQLCHRNVSRLLAATEPWFHFSSSDVWTLFHSYAFDFSVWEMFGALCTGGKLIVVPYWVSRSPDDFLALLREQQVTVLNQTPSAFGQLIHAVEQDAEGGQGLVLKHIIFGGEALEPEMLRPWMDRFGDEAPRLINMYGITETTVHVTYRPITRADLEEGRRSPVGQNIPDLGLKVLDGNLNLALIGVPGELHVSGDGLARGYLNRSALTAERFIADPFDEKGGRLYRTGDLVKWNAEGELEYLGRIDDQVKIRGFRIELGEIEARLLGQPEVREAVVAADDGPGGTRLVGYVSLHVSIEAAQLRERLGRDLPEYMVPSIIMALDALPLNANGKIDRKALPVPEVLAESDYEAPVGEVEETLAAVWAEVLEVKRVGRNDDFFRLGGHSLLALKLLERIRTKGHAVQVRTLFEHPKLADFAQAISQDEQRQNVVVPPNLIPDGCELIEPEMVTLATLTEVQLRSIEASVPGGAANIQDIYPLAPLQEGILFHHLLQEQGDVYLTHYGLNFDSKERVESFIESFNRVIARHDILRTAILWKGLDEPVQVVWRQAELQVQWVDEIGDLSGYRIDVRQAPLIHALVTHDAATQRWRMQLLAHHLMDDNTTVKLIVEEIGLIQQGRETELSQPVPFRRFVAQARLGVSGAEHEAYFKAQLGDMEEPTAPFGLLNVQGDGTRVREARLTLMPELSQAIQEQAKRHGVSPAALFHLVWALVLARTSGRDDVVFGTVLFGRMQGGEGADRALGMFINTLPLRVKLGTKSVMQCLQAVQEMLTQLLHHEHASLALAKKCSAVPGGTPLFSAMLNFRHTALDKQSEVDSGMAWTGIESGVGKERTNYPFDLSINDFGSGFELVAQIDESVAAERICELVQSGVEGVVDALANDAQRNVSTLELLGGNERDQLIEWGVKWGRLPDAAPIHRLIETQVAARPDAVALVFGDQELSYADLNARANRLAHRLIELGVGSEVRVGVALERSVELAVSLLAILKVGGAYVPLDPEHPADRLAHMMGDSEIGLLVTQRGLRQRIPMVQGVGVIEVDHFDLAGEPTHNPDVEVRGAQLAYVIYTSGSTGIPKGVGITHATLAEQSQVAVGYFGLNPQERMLQFSTINFDAFVEQFFSPLVAGAAVVLRGPMLWDSETFYREVLDKDITIADLPASYWHLLAKDFARQGIRDYGRLRQVHTSGEAMPPEGVRAWREAGLAHVKLLNSYGPTEAVVTSVVQDCQAYVDGKRDLPTQMPIGQPLAGRHVYVLDGNLNLAPQGVAGELYIGGPLLARGYLNREALTAERFVADPFDPQGGRLYRTGDLVKWNAEGELEYLGRIDHQVKIRGFRIELGEIEAKLLNQPQVREAVVIASEGPGGTRLVGYVSLHSPVETAELRERLGQALPEYMVPSVIVTLDALPLNANGKIDRKALPIPEVGIEGKHEAPVGKAEEILAAIWSDVLKVPVEKVSRTSNFFELGGDSILSLHVATKARSQDYAITLRQIFEHQMLAALAAAVAESAEASAVIPTLSAARRAAPLPLSYAQQRLWFLWNLDPDSTAYHMGAALKLTGKINVDALQTAFHGLAVRHEALRTVFRLNERDEAEQLIQPPGRAVLEVRDLQDKDPAQEAARIHADPFDLTQGPLLRAVLLKDAKERHVLVVVMHHIVSDDWTIKLVIDELIESYRARVENREPVLTALPIQYADYAIWQRDWMEGGERERQLKYWMVQLGGEQPVLDLVTDHPRRSDSRYRQAVYRLELPADVVDGLRVQAKATRGTVFMHLLAGVHALLHRYSSQQDIRVGVPVANRHHAGIERVAGVFINTQVLRAQLNGKTTLAELIEQVKISALGAQAHQDLPFEELVEALQPERSLNRTPLFQVMFNYLREDGADKLEQLPGLRLERYGDSADQEAKFELTVNAGETTNGSVFVNFEYARELFEASTIERMAGHYVAILRALAERPYQVVGEVELLGEAERAQLITWGVNGERYPDAMPIHRLIETQVEARPDGVALVFGDEELSYAELNTRANRLAHRLIALGVGLEVRVGVALERSTELAVALLAILKAGGTYVPLDPDYPAERLAHMAGDSGIALLVTQCVLQQRIPVAQCVGVIEVDHLDLAGEPEHNPKVAVQGEQLAYVIYTSGSTGVPKGIGITHAALAEHIQVTLGYFGLNPQERMLQFSTVNFDTFVEQFFSPLVAGAVVVLRGPQLWDSETFYQEVLDKGITIADLPTSYWHLLVQDFARQGIRDYGRLRQVQVVGEAMPPEGIRAWREAGLAHVKLLNSYGPTEAVVTAAAQDCQAYVDGKRELPTQMPIGRPLAGRRVYVLDGNLNLVPQGVSGELYIGGPLLARGYLNRSVLTAERFIADPFDEMGGRLYRTGDLVKWNAGGELEYLGRIDDQVKIRGFRIELGEIEAKLLSQTEVREAVVVTSEGPGGARLVACVSLHTPIEVVTLRERLSRELPEYMVPSFIMVLDALPLNANGKIDRKVLPAPEAVAESEYEAPVGEAEETLAAIWAEVLEVKCVGRSGNFFRLGGHSLLALKMLERIRAKGHAVQVRTLFEHPKLADFAQAIHQGEQRQDVVVPPNLIPDGCVRIEPEMVTLATLTEAQLRSIEASVPGGAANIHNIYPLAPLQEGILFHHLLQEQGDVYITSNILGFDTRERLEGFIENFNQVIARHDILRTAVLWEGLDEPVQVVWRRAELKVQWMDAIQDSTIQDPNSYRIDVRQAPMIHALAAFDAGVQRWRLLLFVQHLVSDHTTLELIIQEIGLIRRGRQEDLPEPVPFRRFVAQARLGVSQAEHDAYFRKALGDVQEPTAPFGLLDVHGDGTRGKVGHLRLEQALAESVRTQAKRYGVSAAALFHLAWALVLACATGRDDVVFGTVLFGRMQSGEGAGRALGMFINMLPLRVKLGGGSIFECLKAVQMGLTELLHHEHATLALAQKCSAVPAGTPLFSAILNYRHSPTKDGGKEGVVASAWVGIESLGGGERTNYPFELSVDDLGEGFELKVRLDGSVEPSWVCAAMHTALARLVDGLAVHPHQAVGDVDLLAETERAQLTTWGVNSEHYPDAAPVHRLIEAQALARPEAVALVFGKEELSYAELNARANRLTHRLIALGVGPEVRVGVLLERSVELVVSLLAILKAGGAYVPLDPEFPAERLAYMAEDSGIELLMAHSALIDRVPTADHVRLLEVDTLDLMNESVVAPTVLANGEYLMYVIYTSGSTGKPKGVAVRHAAVSNCLMWMQQAYDLAPGETVLHKAPFGFDVSVWEIFWPLTVGARLVVAAPGEHRDVERLIELIQDRQVTAINFVPTMLKAFLLHEGSQACVGLKHIMCGGEAVGADLQRDMTRRLPDTKLHDLYGPTETTIHITHWTCGTEERDLIPIGSPITDSEAYVLDGNLNLVPQCVAGELYLGGAGLARGYLNRQALMAERFVANPFSQSGGRLYRTGDLVRWNAQGELEYLGRIDHQVKIRGFRIELGEIEARLLSQPEVREAVVVASEGPGGARLVGYVLLHAPIEAAQLRERLSKELPKYMVPSLIMVLYALPLNMNGKIDRKALPTPEVGAEDGYEAPMGEVEKALAKIWADILKVPLEQVGRTSNFFELGGDSILSLQVISRAKVTGHPVLAGLQLRHLMLRPTIASLLGDAEGLDGNLVSLNRASTDTAPLFCIHPGQGGIFDYRPLAQRLAGIRRTYGLVCPMLGALSHNYGSLEEMADEYMANIVRKQPKGPYHLLGWSLGGALAAMVAARLEEQGEAIGYLGMIDSFVPGIHTDIGGNDPGADWREDFKEQFQFIVPGFKIADDLPDLSDLEDVETITHLIDTLIGKAEAAGCARKEAYASFGTQDMARMFIVGRRLSDLAVRAASLPGVRVKPRYWWAQGRSAQAKEALGRQLSSSVEAMKGTVIQAGHFEIMHDPVLLDAVVASLKLLGKMKL